MRTRLGLCIAKNCVQGVVTRRRRVVWAGQAEYQGLDDLADVIGRLAAEGAAGVKRVRVALARDVVQLRTLLPAPPIRGAQRLSRYVALEASRLFRKNGAPLVTGGIPVMAGGERGYWAAAADEPRLLAVAAGCRGAGLSIECFVPSAAVLAHALREVPTSGDVVMPSGPRHESVRYDRGRVVQSRRTAGEGATVEPAWVPALAKLNGRAGTFAAAYAVAVGRSPMVLLPEAERQRRFAGTRRRRIILAAAAAALWCVAGGTFTARLVKTGVDAQRDLTAIQPVVDSVMHTRRQLAAVRSGLDALTRAERGRSQPLVILSALSRTLGDSVFLVSLSLSTDSVVRVAGYGPSATAALADLERASTLDAPRLEGVPAREVVPFEGGSRRELDRFSLVADVQRIP